MANIGRILHFDIDLSLPLKQVHAAPMIEGDRLADVIELSLNNRGEAIDPSGLTAVANAELSGQDGVTVRNPGTVAGGKITIPLVAECYAVPGSIRISVTLTSGTTTRTVLLLTGYVEQNGTGIIIDPSGSIPSYDDLAQIVSQLEAAKQAANTATAAANSAASNASAQASAANTAASAANTAASTANTAASNADNKANAANAAASTANTAAAKIDGLTVSAEGLAAGAAPTASVSETGGHKHISLGIPKGDQGLKGDTGATPNITIGTVTTGSPADKAAVTLTGTAENPVLSFTIPQGTPGTGNGTVTSVNNVEPDEAGNVALDAAAVGALPSGGTAADAHRLGGKAAAYYLTPRNLLDNSDFRAPVNQRGQAAYTSTVMGMTIDRWYLTSTASGQPQTLTLTPEGIRLTGGDPAIVQRIPLLPDGAYTLAVGYADGTVTVASTSAAALNGAGVAQVPIVVPDGSTLRWAALYEGTYTADTLPPYLSRGYAAELAECWRYYRRYLGDILVAFYPNAVALLTANATGMYGTGVPTVTIGSLTRTATAETLAPVSYTVVGRDAIWVGLNVTLTLGEGCYASNIAISTEP